MRALLSVYDKTGLVEFARGLSDIGIELIASGGTSRTLGEAGIAHLEVADVTGAPEMLGGRVKTLHPSIHGGILADRSNPEHVADLIEREIDAIDLVVCNLYPFRDKPSIEMIDVGGPTMVRAAAKNHGDVGIIVDPSDYDAVLFELKGELALSDSTRRDLARKAFAHTAAYDAAIVDWFDSVDAVSGSLAPTVHLTLKRSGELRYGENPHQHGARYSLVDHAPGFWESIVQYGGRELSYLNLFDAEAAWRLVHELSSARGVVAAVIVKHANPCGAATAFDIETAYAKAFDSDPVSAFGGIVALSEPVDGDFAKTIVANALADVLIAPAISPEAQEIFVAKRRNMRALAASAPTPLSVSYRQIDGGFLVQEADQIVATRAEWRVVTEIQPDETVWNDIDLAWRVCARTTSNAIVFANAGQIVGVGCGQQNRLDAAALAAQKAHGRAVGGAAASDAFFPFRDGLDAVADAGLSVVIQPGGSLHDDDVIAAANERGLAMVFTGERHFRH